MGGRRGQATGRQWKQVSSRMKGFVGRISVSGFVLALCIFSLWSRLFGHMVNKQSQIDVDLLWTSSPSFGWRASSYPRSPDWLLPSGKRNGYMLVRCNGGLNQQRVAICNAVLVARIMNAALVLPELDSSSFWNDINGFSGIYDVEHFIQSLKYDVKVVKALPSFYVSGNKTKRLKPFQLQPPRDASPSWYKTVALEKLKEHGAVYLAPFSHRLAEELENHEYQRLRCRVNFHALRFKEDVIDLGSKIVQRLRSEGNFLAMHLRFEMDMLAFSGCLDIFTPAEQELLKEYRQQNFAVRRLVHNGRRLIGKCPLTPEEVGLILHSMGFSNSSQIYLASGDLFGGERFLQKLLALFPRLENRSTILKAEELATINAEGRASLGPAVDYTVSLLADIFMPNYDGPSDFANNLLGHRLYYGFRTTIRPDRKALAPILMEHEKGNIKDFEQNVRTVMRNTWFGGPRPRIPPEPFFVNPWPECFCKPQSENPADECPSSSIMDLFHNQQVSNQHEEIETSRERAA
ncbi:hypothetical protein O6H91_09G087600 [Diphasiastrum complanatum]|nr:hypothetical protein O6H91_09G087600 [Diphasiastrum complanatum]